MAEIKRCTVISGLPGSGKSTVGRLLAASLGADLFDKDVYLEGLFDLRGIGDADWRQQLSRESDRNFERDASTSHFAVLVSHWRPRGTKASSGTPCDWIAETFERTFELHCDCPVEVAAARFRARQRHPGHLDAARGAAEIETWLQACARDLPLGIGQLLRIDTTAAQVEDRVAQIGAVIAETGQ